jgi:pimeloyl-ACP methyl ester carboxylesterase
MKRLSVTVSFALLLISGLLAQKPFFEEGFLSVNNTQQFISIRSSDPFNNPILLFLHGGPGASATVMFQKMNKDLEKYFTVVCWDQRGAGKSFNKKMDESNLTVPQLIDDAHVLIEYLCKRFNKDKVYLIGHSWGSRLGMYLVRIYPELIAGYIAVGQEVSAYEGELQSWQYSYEQAKNNGNKKAIADLEEMGQPQSGNYLNMYKTGFWGIVKQKEWLLKLGGERYGRTNYKDWIGKMFMGYNMNLFQLIKWSKASATSAGTMFHDPAFNNFDLRKDIVSVKVPVHFVSGVADYNTPWPLVKEYAELLKAPSKSFTLFNKSGHSPLFEQAEGFNALVREKFLKN